MRPSYFCKLIIYIFFLSLFFSGCSDLFDRSDNFTAKYELSGTRVELTYDFPWPSWGGKEVILSADTTHVEYLVEVRFFPEGKQDTVRFDELAGANAGDYSAVSTRCSKNTICHPDAHFDGKNLTFDLLSPTGRYTGTGTLTPDSLILDTHFEYRNVGVDFYLQGEAVDD
jgi:hypothetical protein